jgi:hypothetical protein
MYKGFNVFPVRALYYTQKTLITNKCTKSFIINCNTLLHVSTLLGHLQGQLFCYRYTKVALYSWVRMCCSESSRLQKQRSTKSTAHSHSTIKCNLSVTITKSSPWRWPSRVETCRIVLQLMIKLSLCICWWSVFFVCIKDIWAPTYVSTNRLSSWNE